MIRINTGPVLTGSRAAGELQQALPEDKMLMHLLKRCLCGVSFADYQHFQNKPIAEVVFELLNSTYEPGLPLKDYSSVNGNTPDFRVPLGETWVNDIHYDNAVNQKRKQSLKKWLIQTLYTQQRSIRPRMVLLWQQYFPIQIDRLTLASKAWDYFSTLADHALENFRGMVLYQATSFALLEYHKKIRPASTSLHKFHASTILDQFLFGDDSSNYISKDRIKRFTRLLNEWNALYDALSVNGRPSASQLMEKPAIREYMEEMGRFINRLMQHEKIAQTLAGRLFRWFVNGEADKNSRIIHKMMETALDQQYDIKKILASMLLHEQFYDPRYYGCLVKTPLEFTFGLWKELDIAYLQSGTMKYSPQWDLMLEQIELLGQPVGNPLPGIKWLNPEQLKQRSNMIAQVTPVAAFDGLRVTRQVDCAANLGQFTAFLTNFYSTTNFSLEKRKAVREFLDNQYSLSEEGWTSLLEHSRANPDDQKAATELRNIVRGLMLYFLDSPEYHFF